MTRLESEYHPQIAPADYARLYFSHLATLMQALDAQALGRAMETIENAAAGNHTVFIAGNGGSAAVASHFANDLHIGAAASGHPKFRAISLFDNQAIASCIANDFGYAQVFRKQLEAHLQPKDVLIALSVSGNSPNILEAAEYTRQHGGLVIGCTGCDGGRLRDLSDISLHVRSGPQEHGPVEDLFQIINHVVVTYLQLRRRGALGAER